MKREQPFVEIEKIEGKTKKLGSNIKCSDISWIVDNYFQDIWYHYNMSRDSENFSDVQDFLKEFFSLSKEEFFEDVEDFRGCKETFTTIYLLVTGDERGVSSLINNHKDKLKPDSMSIKEYALKMKEKSIPRLKGIIHWLDEYQKKEKKVDESRSKNALKI